MDVQTLGGASPSSPDQSARTAPKILVLVTEDWFALSHFEPLLATLMHIGREVVVATRSSGRLAEIAALGPRVIDFDFERANLDPRRQAAVVQRIVRLIASEAPDVVHVIAMQPMVATAIALAFRRQRPRLIMHLTGLGFLGISRSRAARVIRPFGMAALASALKRPSSHLLAENPEDAEYLRAGGVRFGDRMTLLGGAGLDPALFPALPPPRNAAPVSAFVGRMIEPKGVRYLVEAHQHLCQRGVSHALELYGKADRDNPDAIDDATLARWATMAGVTWAGHVADVAAVWARCDIAVLPAITREGLPRSVLEAAACARPLIVTDVPGCRHFVRDGVEGLIVPPADATALADAIARLAADPALRDSMGRAARRRVLDGFTVDHVQAGIRAAYASVLA